MKKVPSSFRLISARTYPQSRFVGCYNWIFCYLTSDLREVTACCTHHSCLLHYEHKQKKKIEKGPLTFWLASLFFFFLFFSTRSDENSDVGGTSFCFVCFSSYTYFFPLYIPERRSSGSGCHGIDLCHAQVKVEDTFAGLLGKKKEKGVECIIIPNVQSNFPILSLCFLFFLVFSPQKEKKKFKFKPAWNKWMETSVCCCGLDSVSLHTHTYIYNCAGGTCQTGCNASYYTIVPVFDL